MRVGRRLLLLAGLLVVAAVTTAVAVGATWGSAIEVPGTATLNVKGAEVTSVSCAAAGFCAAGGEYVEASGGLDGTGAEQAFVVDEKNGVWGTAIPVPGLKALNADGDARLFQISCPKAGFCSAAGFYRAGNGDGHGFLLNEKNGVWGKATKIPGVPTFGGSFSVVDGIACVKAGFCTAVGGSDDSHGYFHGLAVTETNGVWHKAVSFAKNTEVDAISCPAAGFCTVSGSYDGACPCQGFVLSQKKGVWGKVQILPGLKAINNGLDALSVVSSISCITPRSCSASGYYTIGDDEHPFVADEKNGVWGKAIKLSGVAALGPGDVGSVSCAAPGQCAAGGSYTDSSDHSYAFVVSEKNSVWGVSEKVKNLGDDGVVWSVSCTKTGFCAAGGSYADSGGAAQAFVVNQQGGVWQGASEVPGTAALNLGGDANVWSISCVGNGSCAAGGYYRGNSGVLQAFVTAP